MRRKLVAGNWKMFGLKGDLPEVAAIAAAAAANPGVDVAICPPFTLIEAAVAVAGAMPIGAQDVHEEDQGAYTGSVSAPMLVEAGARLVIVGHSERRDYQRETSHDAWAKAAAARRHGLGVILCCGETHAERDRGRAENIVQSQIEKSLPDGATGDWLTIAYEPRWAIGTGNLPSLDEIASIHGVVRDKLRAMVGDAAEGVRILYGGSVKAENAEAILGAENVDGALVGGASLTADKFVPIIEAAARL
jgi:triosephosphate isomerase